jgi:hypothetical protein
MRFGRKVEEKGAEKMNSMGSRYNETFLANRLTLTYAVKRSHLPKVKNQEGDIYYLFDDAAENGVHLEWLEKDVKKFDCLWKAGCTLKELVTKLNRNDTEITLLAVDRAIKGMIDSRKGGLFGG